MSLAREKPGESCCTTWTPLSASGPDVCSWIGNWIPVLLSGGICVQSTLSSVNILVGSFGYSFSASALVPRRRSRVTSNAYRVLSPWTVARVAIRIPFSHTSAVPTTPLTISWACCERPRLEGNVVRNHHGTLNMGIVSRPTWLM